MTPQPNWSVARSELERVAQDLRAKDYEVLVEPAASEVPDFVRDYQPDIVAKGSKDCLIVEVKQPLSAPERDRIRTIARRVEGHHGWRFLLVAPDPQPSDSTPGPVKPIETPQVRNWLNEARALVRSAHSRSALLIAWAGLEAAMRVAANIHSLSGERSDSWALMRDLVSNGILNRESYRELTELFRIRSAFADGLQPAAVPPDIDLDQAVESMCSLAEQLIGETASTGNESEQPA